MPQAKSGGSKSSGSRSSSASKSGSGRSTAKRASSSSSGAKSRSTRASASKSRSTSGSRSTSRSRSTGSARSTRSKASTGTVDARVEQVATRLRKLNERIIEAGKEAGESTLSSYEKALKAIAATIEKGPGSSEIDWISNMASAQAKFIRDVTNSWTKAARDRLK